MCGQDRSPPRTAGGTRKHVPVMGGIFEQSPRTLNQTRKGAPEKFLGAQEVELGGYSERMQGTAIPHGWDKEVAVKTRSELLARRRQSFIPDISFDLDGDGIVSREDWTASIKADRDRDGRLNTAERAHAEAIVKGKAPFDLFKEQRPITAPVRVNSVGWPEYDKPNDDPPLTRTHLLSERRRDMVERNHENYLRNEEAAARSVPAWKRSAEFSECRAQAAAQLKPKKVRSVEMEAGRQAVRVACGLEATMTSVNPARTAMDPVAHVSGQVRYEDQRQFTLMGYRADPIAATRSHLLATRKQDNLERLEEGLQRVGPTFRNERQRLEARENQFFLQGQLALQNPDNKVRSLMMSTRKEDNVAQLIGMWGNDPEPPSNEATRAPPGERKAFWLYSDAYQPEPSSQSALALRQSRKWYKKVPEYFLEEGPPAWGEGGPADPYQRKAKRLPARAAGEGAETRVGEASQPAERGPYLPRPPAKGEIRVHVQPPSPDKHTLSEEAQAAADARELAVPLYSSFAVDRTYNPRPLPRSRPGTTAAGSRPRAHADAAGGGGGGGRAAAAASEAPAAPLRMREMLSNLPSKFSASRPQTAVTAALSITAGAGRDDSRAGSAAGKRRSLASSHIKVRTRGVLGPS